MKTNFKKTLAVFLAVLMLVSVFGVTGFAAKYTATINAGTASGVTRKDSVTDDMLKLTSNNSGKVTLPSEAYFEREGFVQDGWTKTANGTGTKLKFGSSQTLRNNNTKFYPYWVSTSMTISFEAGSLYDADDVNNYTDSSMATLKSQSTVINLGDGFTFPGAMFTRLGYTQTGWTTSSSGTGKCYEFNSAYPDEVTKDMTFYPYWSAKTYTVNFLKGADGTGTDKSFTAEHDSTVKAPGEIFTREGYTQIGWATTDGAQTVELNFNTDTPYITDDVTYYPVWRRDVFAVDVSADSVNFGTMCVDYSVPAAETVTVTNEGNSPITYTLPTSGNYNITLKSGSLTIDPNESFTVSIQPKASLSAGAYKETVTFTASKSQVSFSVSLAFKVSEHSYGKYSSNGDATYTHDGTKTAECLNGCGSTHTKADDGSQKVYSIDNNDAVGLSSSYKYHRTVRFQAYGSGMDDTEGVVGKRFLPVSWYVNDDFNGEFEDGNYDVVFTHTIFGDYTLVINYVEQEYNADTEEWVETGVTDTKVFEYTVGTTDKEEQEIVRPNTILSIIFGLFAELLSLLGIGK